MLLRILALIWLVLATSNALAQEALSNGLPQKENAVVAETAAGSAWIDLRQHPSAASRPQSAPDWVEAVNMTSATGPDGTPRTVLGAYLDWMSSSEVVHPVNAEHRDVIPEPFSSLPPLHSPEQDLEHFGTVTATLASETIPIGSDFQHAGEFQFGIEAQPLLALLTFEVASPRIDSPPEVYVNGEDVGAATLTLPELADPGYRGQMEALLKEMRFQYTGWLRGQKLIPVSNLKVGTNDVIILSGSATSTSAIRGTQVQLKYLWEKSDYLLQADH